VSKTQKIVKKILEGENLSQYQLAQILNLTPAMISRYLNNSAEMRPSTLKRLKDEFPAYKEEAASVLNQNGLMSIPLVLHYAHADFDNQERNGNLPMTYVNEEEQVGDYYVFEIKGDSMEADGGISINENDKVLALKISKDNWSDIHFKKYLFIIVCGGVACKQITKFDNDAGEITCHSLNPIYDDYTIKMDDVKQLFYIKKIVERKVNL